MVVSAINPGEMQALKEFKDEMREIGLYRVFSDTNHFGKELRNQLDLVMNKLLRSDEAKTVWSQKAVLDEQDKLAMEKKRIELAVHRIQMGYSVGQRI